MTLRMNMYQQVRTLVLANTSVLTSERVSTDLHLLAKIRGRIIVSRGVAEEESYERILQQAKKANEIED